MSPIVSVIIPTANRPHYLPRAIDSALAGMKLGSVEVIVVPNGPDESWRRSLLPYESNKNIRAIHVREANANIARNVGLAYAQGKFVRFLDDDDYLISEGAVKQYSLIQSEGVDVVSGSIQLVNEHGRYFDIWHQPDIDDLCTAMLTPYRKCQPTAHVYRRSILSNASWNIKTKVHQDYEWFFDLCASRELSWLKTNDIVGVYWKHRKQRLSTTIQYNHLRYKVMVPMLKRTFNKLLVERRLDESRRLAVAEALWACVHAAFFLEPKYWSKIGQLAQRIDPKARPIQPIYIYPVLKHINPLFIQWLLFPKRWITYQIRQIKKNINLNNMKNIFNINYLIIKNYLVYIMFFICLQLKCLILILILYLIKPLLSYFNKNKKIWLIGENFGESLKDNGYCFFRYCNETQVEPIVFFLTKRSSIKTNIFLSSNMNVLIYGSVRHVLYLLLADVFIYSHTHRDLIFNKLFFLIKKNKKLVFLQHGVTGFKKFNPDYKKNCNEPDILIVVSEFEKSIISNYVGTDLKKIKVTGFARYDSLIDKTASKKQNQISYMPTWRDWVKPAKFLENKFYNRISTFINDDSLAKLLIENNIILKFYLHKNMKNYLSFFKNKNDRIQFIEFGQESVQKMIKESILLITDYSSVSWDFFYLGKPVIFYQFDFEDYIKNRGTYIDLKKDTFGDRVISNTSMIKLIEFNINNNFKVKKEYKELTPKFFKYSDKLNCNRIYQEIMRL